MAACILHIYLRSIWLVKFSYILTRISADEVAARTGFDKETVRECVSNMYERRERYDNAESVTEQLLKVRSWMDTNGTEYM
jgi:hypothetical protein